MTDDRWSLLAISVNKSPQTPASLLHRLLRVLLKDCCKKASCRARSEEVDGEKLLTPNEEDAALARSKRQTYAAAVG